MAVILISFYRELSGRNFHLHKPYSTGIICCFRLMIHLCAFVLSFLALRKLPLP